MINILIVDDEELSRILMEEIFRKYGKSVSVSSGEDAILVFEKAVERKTGFDLVLLDISLQEISGQDVLRKIRKIEAENGLSGNNAATIIMVTAHGEKEIVLDCIEAGCNGYFIKPLKLESVQEKMEEFGFTPVQ